MTTLFLFLPGNSASTLICGRSDGGSICTWAVDPAAASAAPSANDAPTTGMATMFGPPSVPMMRPSRSGVLPWLKMITASAPAASALSALVPNVHVPRCIRAMSFGPLKSSPAKSAASHPLVTGSRGGVRTTSTGTTFPVTSPVPAPVNPPVS